MNMTATATPGQDTPAPVDARFLGHPAGLGWLAFCELWERFSYYGMQALLVIYLSNYLFMPENIGNVAGMHALREAIESVTGPRSTQQLASAVFGLYAGFVYLTPLFGGLLADRWLGRTRTVVTGASLMALGHFLMAFEASFLLALLCLLLGGGCFKGNIATQVGELYTGDDPRRADAFQIYMFGIQLAVIASPLVCGTLGETVGWHWGFGAAGVGMLVGLALYLVGRPDLPVEPRGRAGGATRSALAPHEKRTIALLIGLLPVLALALVGTMQIFNAYLLWAEQTFNLSYFGHTVPVTWLLTLDAILSAATIAGSVVFWKWWARRWREPADITKMTLGALIAAAGPLVLAVAAWVAQTQGTRVGLGWALAFALCVDTGFANVFTVGLALYSRCAPSALRGLIVGVYYLQLFLANMLVGWLGGLLERMSGVKFWLLHAGLIGLAALGLAVMRPAFMRALPDTSASPA